jgi:hypothetical protein
MTYSGSWFRVNVLEVKVGTHSIGSTSSFQSGKGTIVDSGTTDTYLPRSVASGFTTAFRQATGKTYHAGSAMSLTPAQLNALPSVYFKLDALIVEVKPNAYMDHTGGSTYKVNIGRSKTN